MKYLASRMATLAVLSAALIAAPSVNNALAAALDTPAYPSPPPAQTKSAPEKGAKSDSKKKTKEEKAKEEKAKDDKRSSVDDPAFLKGYREAYATIFERSDYTGAIAQLKTLGQDDLADVANLIGYSYRKLGNYELASVWYERALKADPNHARTWQYYGLWQVEQGNREQAKYHLAKIEQIAGQDSKEYRSLAEAISTGTAVY